MGRAQAPLADAPPVQEENGHGCMGEGQEEQGSPGSGRGDGGGVREGPETEDDGHWGGPTPLQMATETAEAGPDTETGRAEKRAIDTMHRGQGCARSACNRAIPCVRGQVRARVLRLHERAKCVGCDRTGKERDKSRKGMGRRDGRAEILRHDGPEKDAGKAGGKDSGRDLSQDGLEGDTFGGARGDGGWGGKGHRSTPRKPAVTRAGEHIPGELRPGGRVEMDADPLQRRPCGPMRYQRGGRGGPRRHRGSAPKGRPRNQEGEDEGGPRKGRLRFPRVSHNGAGPETDEEGPEEPEGEGPGRHAKARHEATERDGPARDAYCERMDQLLPARRTERSMAARGMAADPDQDPHEEKRNTLSQMERPHAGGLRRRTEAPVPYTDRLPPAEVGKAV